MRAARIIADWATDLQFDDLPDEAVALVRRAHFDTLAVTLSGSRLPSSRIVASIGASGPGPCSVIGRGGTAGPLEAALINGTSAHAELYDDNNEPMIAHPSAPLVSALLPLAQKRGRSGRDLICAYGAGFEVGVTLGRQLNPRLYEAGWHVTRVLGVLGVATACSRLIGLDPARAAQAIGIACSMASGVRQNFGTMTMAFHAGLTARDGVHAALLAEADFRADDEALEGRYGFFNLFAGHAPDRLAFGEPFELVTSGIIFKPFPSGAPTHAAVDAALGLRDELGGDLDRVVRVRCLMHPWNAMTLREGVPNDTLRARVSLRYCVAAALRFGALGTQQFTDEALQDPLVRELMDRIVVELSADLPDNGLFPAEVRLQLTDGRELAARREVPPGAPERPWTDEQARVKFDACAAGILAPEVAAHIRDLIARLDDLPNVAELCRGLEGTLGP